MNNVMLYCFVLFSALVYGVLREGEPIRIVKLKWFWQSWHEIRTWEKLFENLDSDSCI
jgi:hypothetical protein